MKQSQVEAVAERRKEKRRQAQGVVYCSRPAGGQFLGRLVDVSASGFRMVHDDGELVAGDRIVFRHPFAAGVAVAVWNRFTEGRRETGFLLERRE